ncbi:hypothetical protein BBF96_02860 [Anoxybacter fermentans]|uniref:DNA repair protein n=1 Tax=Anoxybacter fermentans TaxID=1323375 RepID=A0A3S9SVT4_9FIRM|nr:CRISPR-associated endonuclease Cas6 [Anoxybacter fermentans]AZR72427.1 hypothetical protein BBF96_02860 [Anoxybacter fermentans]
MIIKQSILQFEIGENLSLNYGHYLRGYFANRFSEVLFHNHLQDGKLRYGYPLIQYKIVEGKPIVIGLNEGADLLGKYFLDLTELVLRNKVYKGFEKKLEVKNIKIKTTSTMKYCYQFLSPWVALNQKNYHIYLQNKNSMHFNEKEFLQRLLVGNILSFAKSIGWWVESQIFILPEVRQVMVNFKGQKLIGFVGHFYSNVALPDLIGLGNSSARGFGTIKRKVRI